MTHQIVARDLLAVLCSLQGMAVLATGLNFNHAKNPSWAGHARFHVVWQTIAFSALAILELALLFAAGPLQAQRFYLAAILTGIPMLGFFSAFVSRGYYKGVLSEPSGMPPAAVQILGAKLLIEANLAAEILGVLALLCIVILYHLCLR